MTVEVEFPMALKNPLNAREHWGAKAKRAKKQRDATLWALKAERVHDKLPLVRWPLVVTLTRIYTGRMGRMDDDGLSAAFKWTRDSIAAYIGVDDADPRITFRCEQLRGPKGAVAAVRISLAVESA